MELCEFEKIAADLIEKHPDFSQKTIPFQGGLLKLFYIAQLTDRAAFSENVVKPLILHCSAQKPINAKMAEEGILYADDCSIESDLAKIETFILDGMTVVLFSTDPQYLVVNLKKVAHRTVATPQLMYTLRGAQDCFVENLDDNLSLIRYRLKDKNLRIVILEAGRRTKTRIAVLYIQDIANDTVVNEVQKRIGSIDVDGIGESGELQSYLLNNKLQLFPTMGLLERSDMAFHALLEGKVLVVVDGSGIVLLAPKIFSEFLHSCDDRYDNKYYGLFMRIIRYIALSIAFTITSLYVAMVSFHSDALPSKYVIMLAEMHVDAPFTALIGALLIEFIVELLREAMLRVPKQIGPAVGIVGAIVIGQAAMAAGIFSPVLLIFAAVSLLASFAISDYSIMSPFRILKFILLLFTGTLGFYGFSLFLTFILAQIVSINSFGVPYLAPWAPFNLRDFLAEFIHNSTLEPQRPHYLRTKDTKRAK